MYGQRSFHKSAKQTWSIGETVKVGFVDGLEVIKKVQTPGDYRPDFWVLWQAKTNRFYAFQPHFGITRCASVDEAMSSFI